jgi:hypothetical protein
MNMKCAKNEIQVQNLITCETWTRNEINKVILQNCTLNESWIK